MKIIEKLVAKNDDVAHYEGATIAFLGDSVTQGCFEIYKKENNVVETVFDKRYSYEMGVFEILNLLFPSATVNIINAGISGDRASVGALRMERDVLRHQPDLTVVCYGLNDCNETPESVTDYTAALQQIFTKLKESGSEIIFMTPNMMNTKVSPHVTDPDFINIATRCAKLQNEGIFDAHIAAARQLCQANGIPVCDCYAICKTLAQSGVNTTELLSNHINHPTREMNKLFSMELVRTMFTA